VSPENQDEILYIDATLPVCYPRPMSIITLLTDFGLKDGNVGVMKGVIWRYAPDAQIADLSHLVSPQNIDEAALILRRSAPYFPEGSIHLVVVDPGVGTARRPIAGRLGSHFFVGPDNGVVTLLLEYTEGKGESASFVQLDRPEFWLPEVSHVFHGRDIFAPVVGHLASGQPLEAFGEQIADPVRLHLPQPLRTSFGWRGEIIYIDHFGNLASNIYAEQLAGRQVASVSLSGIHIQGMVHTFGERPPGEIVALFGSTGNLIVCEVNGSAARRLDARVGDVVEVVQDA
jgi:S-adenosyl-L-methionine hydrolase (adenosine-forming)